MELSDLRVCKAKITQYEAPVADLKARILEELQKVKPFIHPGMQVAVAVGSRGIANMAQIAKLTADFVKACGGDPFFVPAMGSHGGATGTGQAAVLKEYGISEDSLGYPVRSSMAVETIGSTGGVPDIPVYMDRNAWESDGVIAINRVKSHTDFHGQHESGIVKILAIGLGKKAQAALLHQYGAAGLERYIPEVSRVVLDSGKILGALGILEDGYDNTGDVAFALPQDIFAVDRMLLERSRKTMARLPFDQIDLLVVDCMGKNYSGTGLDTNVIGRLCIAGQQDGKPSCGKIVTLDLSPESKGNALGIGLADVIPRRLYNKVDWDITMENVITSGFFERGFTPVVRESDRDAIATALRCCSAAPDTIRFARIRNTLDLCELYLSPALLQELPRSQLAGVPGPPVPLEFYEDGRISTF